MTVNPDQSTNVNNPLFHPISQSPGPASLSPVFPIRSFNTYISTTPVQSPIQSGIQPLLNQRKICKKQRHMKGEYKRKLKEENFQLKKQIKEYLMQISTKEAENAALLNQLNFFRQLLCQDAVDNLPNQVDSDDNNNEEK